MGALLHQKNRRGPGLGGKGFFGALAIPPLLEIFDTPGAFTWNPHPNAFIVKVIAVSGGMGGGGANNTNIFPGQYLEGQGGFGGGWATATYAASVIGASVPFTVGAGGLGMAADVNAYTPQNFGTVSWFGGTPGSNPGYYVFAGAPSLLSGGVGQALGGTLRAVGTGGTPGRAGQGITVLPPNPFFPGNVGVSAPGGAGSGGHMGLVGGLPPGVAAPPTFNAGAMGLALYAGNGGDGGSSATVPGGAGKPGGKYGGGGGGGALALNSMNSPLPSGAGGNGGGGAIIVVTTFR